MTNIINTHLSKNVQEDSSNSSEPLFLYIGIVMIGTLVFFTLVSFVQQTVPFYLVSFRVKSLFCPLLLYSCPCTENNFLLQSLVQPDLLPWFVVKGYSIVLVVG